LQLFGCDLQVAVHGRLAFRSIVASNLNTVTA
jgi:hypothetical protein